MRTIVELIVIGAAIFFIVFAIDRLFAKANEVAADSSIRALLAGLQDHGKEIPFFGEFATGQWKRLGDQDYDRVISSLSQKRVGFDQKGWQLGQPLVDHWGSRYQIFYRKTEKDLEFMSRSAGRDRKFGTDDDIIPPFPDQDEWKKAMANVR
jgi:hypothetical protein